MASARGDALEWALALARAPGERHHLRQQPLPEGMEALLQVAGGRHPGAMAKAEADAGRPAAEVVEAARFYLREMLFFPGADAYRLLGLAPDASDEQLKHHHRLLQQWLHPDRPTSEWDAAFAARVNAAWSQLRTPARRKEYAAIQPPPSAVVARAPRRSAPAALHLREPAAAGAVRGGGLPADGIDDTRWRRRAPVLALFGVCAVLGTLAVRDLERAPERRLDGGTIAQATSTDDTAGWQLRLPTLPAAGNAAPPRPADAAAPARRSRQGASATPSASAPKARAIARETARAPVAVSAGRPVQPPEAVASVGQPVAAVPVIQPLATALVPARASIGATAQAMPLAESAVKPSGTTGIPLPQASPPAPIAAVASPVQAASRVREPAPPVASGSAPAAAVSPPPRVPAAPPAADFPVQVAQAQRTGQQLLDFVAGSDRRMPPIWANYAAQTQASRARQALQGNGRIAVGAPDWRVGVSTAAMQASLTPRDGDAQRLRVDLVWRDQRWLVTSLALEQTL